MTPPAPPHRVTVEVRHGTRVWTLGPIGADGPCDLELVNRIVRLALIVRRQGGTVRLVSVAPELQELLDLLGLPAEVLGTSVR